MPIIRPNQFSKIPRIHHLRKPHNVGVSHDLPCDIFIKTPKNQEPKKKISEQLMWNFRQYMLCRKMNLNITTEEFNKLFALEGEEFKADAFKLLAEKMKIPQELTPGFVYSNEKNCPMFYNLVTNTIAVNPNVNMDKKTFLTLLRHELQHYSQNINMLRHETKGTELIEAYSKMSARQGCSTIDNCVRNIDLEQLKQCMSESNLAEFNRLKDLLKNSPAEYEQYLKNTEKELYNTNIEQYTNFRKTIVEKYGGLKENSQEGKRAEKMFNETVAETGYWKENGDVHYGQYFLQDCRENEAIAAQDSMVVNISSAYDKNPLCYIKNLREAQDKVINGEINVDTCVQKDLEETIYNMNEWNLSMKQIMSYLFD